MDAIQEGDALYEDAGKAKVGVITGIRTEPAEAAASFPDGTIETVPVEDRFDVYLTVSATGVKKDGIYQVGTYRLRQNDSILFYTKYSIWAAVSTNRRWRMWGSGTSGFPCIGAIRCFVRFGCWIA